MNKMCVAYLGVLLLALHLSSQVVLAQSTTAGPKSTPTSFATPKVNSTVSMTTKGKNGSGRNDAFTLLLPLALSASLLHSWS